MAVANSGGSTRPENCHSGETCTWRISSMASGDGPGGGRGVVDEKTRAGTSAAEPVREEEGAAAGVSLRTEVASGCPWFACCKTLYSMLGAESGSNFSGGPGRRATGTAMAAAAALDCNCGAAANGTTAANSRGEVAGFAGSSARHWHVPGVPATGNNWPPLKKNSPASGTIILSPLN